MYRELLALVCVFLCAEASTTGLQCNPNNTVVNEFKIVKLRLSASFHHLHLQPIPNTTVQILAQVQPVTKYFNDHRQWFLSQQELVRVFGPFQ